MEEKNELEEVEEKLEKQIKKIKIGIIITVIVLVIFFFISSYLYIYDSAKPIIYIYPEEEMEVTIKLNNTDKLTTTYPKYEDGWKILAKPDGTLTDIKTGRNLYSLYWEGKNAVVGNMQKGFVIKGENTAQFLEEKLAILGLNEKETEEFIIYWLPKMEHNNYNYIYFQTDEEIKRNMELEITPEPETLIRVIMEYKPLTIPIKIQEQELKKVERKGYTVVEWGGTERKNIRNLLLH